MELLLFLYELGDHRANWWEWVIVDHKQQQTRGAANALISLRYSLVLWMHWLFLQLKREYSNTSYYRIKSTKSSMSVVKFFRVLNRDRFYNHG